MTASNDSASDSASESTSTATATATAATKSNGSTTVPTTTTTTGPVNAKNTVRTLKPSAPVGFESLPEQYVCRTIREGFVFNILILGATGIGKTTLVDSLFNTKFPDTSTHTHQSLMVDLQAQSHELQEKQIKLKLTIVESRGFGDQLVKADSYKAIVEYIDKQYEKYLQEELKIHRSANLSGQDSRIHCCLYLISPIGHGLAAVDLLTMKHLDNKVNLIPIIAKADTITKSELSALRLKIMNEIIMNGIQIYKFPTDDDDASISKANLDMNALLPFAVVASHDFVRVGNKQVRARQYPWGTVLIENQEHCDFVKLREMLLRVNMEDLRETTHSKHYEVYRRTRLEQMGFGDTGNSTNVSSFQEAYEARKDHQKAELKRKEEEIRIRFVNRIREKEVEMDAVKKDLERKYEALKTFHQTEKKKIEDERRRLEEEIQAFHRKKATILQPPNMNQSTTSLASSLTLGGKNKKK
ncbi:septin-2-like [Brevipalpus obovatus]|uniref:septin-2-like n=1 Tax=Brevipalpus obovatus TaxID=246614 RepID=UPI003D9F762B